jgi:hypothetical protein
VSWSWTTLEGVLRGSSDSRVAPQAPDRSRLLLVLAAVALAGVLIAAGVRAVALATALPASFVGLGLFGFLVAGAVLAPFDRLERRRQPGRASSWATPVVLERAEQRLELARSFAGQFEPLRRDLRAVAEQRLAGRGLRFESGEARALLGAEAWRLLAGPLADDKFSSGVDDARLERLIASLEEV